MGIEVALIAAAAIAAAATVASVAMQPGAPSMEQLPLAPTRADASTPADAERQTTRRKTLLVQGTDVFDPNVLRSTLGSGDVA